MKMIRHEMFALFRDKVVWIALMIAVLLECFLFWSVSDRGEVSPEEYRELKKYVQEHIDREDLWDPFNKDELSEAENAVLAELDTVYEYSDFLLNLLDEVKQKQNSSLYRSSYNQNYLRNAEEKYSELKTISPVFVGGYGLEMALSFQGKLVVLLLLIIFYIYRAFLREKKNGLRGLTRVTLHGRILGLVKQIPLILYTAVAVAILFFADILVGIMMFGTVPLSAPVQSLHSFSGTALQLSVGGLLVFSCVYLILITALVAEIMMVFSLCSSNEFIFSILTVIFFAVSYLLTLLPNYGIWSIIEKLGIFSNLDPAGVTVFYYYDIFGMAVNRLPMNIIVYLILILLMAALGYIIYWNDTGEYRSFRLFQGKKAKKTTRIYGQFSLELFKGMIGYKGVILLIVLSVFSFVLYSSKDSSLSETEVYYAWYMKKIEGEITGEKEKYIQREYEKWHEELMELESIPGERSKEIEERIRTAMRRTDALSRCVERMDYLKKQTISHPGLIYEKGWNYLLGSPRDKNDLRNTLFSLFGMILFAAILWAGEYPYRMEEVERMSLNYRKMMKQRLLISLMFLSIALFLIYGIEYIWISQNYGLNAGGFSAASIPRYSELPIAIQNMSIRGFYFLLTGIRMVFLFAVTFFIGWFGRKTKNMGSAILFGILLFILPIVLYLVGILGSERFTALFFMSGKAMLGY